MRLLFYFIMLYKFFKSTLGMCSSLGAALAYSVWLFIPTTDLSSGTVCTL